MTVLSKFAVLGAVVSVPFSLAAPVTKHTGDLHADPAEDRPLYALLHSISSIDTAVARSIERVTHSDLTAIRRRFTSKVVEPDLTADVHAKEPASLLEGESSLLPRSTTAAVPASSTNSRNLEEYLHQILSDDLNSSSNTSSTSGYQHINTTMMAAPPPASHPYMDTLLAAHGTTVDTLAAKLHTTPDKLYSLATGWASGNGGKNNVGTTKLMPDGRTDWQPPGPQPAMPPPAKPVLCHRRPYPFGPA